MALKKFINRKSIRLWLNALVAFVIYKTSYFLYLKMLKKSHKQKCQIKMNYMNSYIWKYLYNCVLPLQANILHH